MEEAQPLTNSTSQLNALEIQSRALVQLQTLPQTTGILLENQIEAHRMGGEELFSVICCAINATILVVLIIWVLFVTITSALKN